jgi:hypothetical protein
MAETTVASLVSAVVTDKRQSQNLNPVEVLAAHKKPSLQPVYRTGSCTNSPQTYRVCQDVELAFQGSLLAAGRSFQRDEPIAQVQRHLVIYREKGSKYVRIAPLDAVHDPNAVLWLKWDGSWWECFPCTPPPKPGFFGRLGRRIEKFLDFVQAAICSVIAFVVFAIAVGGLLFMAWVIVSSAYRCLTDDSPTPPQEPQYVLEPDPEHRKHTRDPEYLRRLEAYVEEHKSY